MIQELRRGIAAGILATMTMDAAMFCGAAADRERFDSERLSVQVIGRWAGDLLRCHWRHEDISRDPQRSGEAVLGMLTHYTTGVILTGGFLALPHRRPPRLGEAVAYGLATSVFPLLVMFPSMGYGFLGRRSGEGPRLVRIMLLGHTAFGFGIGIAARRAQIRPASSAAGRA